MNSVDLQVTNHPWRSAFKAGYQRFCVVGLLLAASIHLTGCSLPGSGVDVGGDLKLLYAPFSLTNPPRYWHYSVKPQNSSPSKQPPIPALEWQDKDGKIALAAHPAAGSFELGRRTNILVLASPYLSFDWQQNSSAQTGDIELVLGFRRQDQGDWQESDFGSGKPSIDQTVRIPIGNPQVTYGQWQREYFDLAGLYRRYWPDAPSDEIRLVWIGVASGKNKQAAVNGITYLTQILLSR